MPTQAGKSPNATGTSSVVKNGTPQAHWRNFRTPQAHRDEKQAEWAELKEPPRRPCQRHCGHDRARIPQSHCHVCKIRKQADAKSTRLQMIEWC